MLIVLNKNTASINNHFLYPHDDDGDDDDDEVEMLLVLFFPVLRFLNQSSSSKFEWKLCPQGCF